MIYHFYAWANWEYSSIDKMAKYDWNTFRNYQGWGEYYSGSRLAEIDKHEYTKNIVLK